MSIFDDPVAEVQWGPGAMFGKLVRKRMVGDVGGRAAVGLFAWVALVSCSTIGEKRKDLGFPVELPFMRMEPSECYYLDDFLPTPDNLVSGRNGGLYLRYYTYNSAIYKFWKEEKVMLAFYSRDQRCWSLFEEYATSGFSL